MNLDIPLRFLIVVGAFYWFTFIERGVWVSIVIFSILLSSINYLIYATLVEPSFLIQLAMLDLVLCSVVFLLYQKGGHFLKMMAFLLAGAFLMFQWPLRVYLVQHGLG